jgi:hypothetical protein
MQRHAKQHAASQSKQRASVFVNDTPFARLFSITNGLNTQKNTKIKKRIKSKCRT